MAEVNNNTIPTLTNLVASGNPSKKARKQSKNSSSSHLDDLNQRIDEIENAIGQDNSGPVGRAFAIRAETNKLTNNKTSSNTKSQLQKTK